MLFLWRAGKFFSFSCSLYQGLSGFIAAPPSYSRTASDPQGWGRSLCPWALLLWSCWVSAAGPARAEPLAAADEAVWKAGTCKEFYTTTHRSWRQEIHVGSGQDRQELGATAQSCVRGGSSGYRECRPWELQPGGQLRKRKVEKE